MVEGAPLDRLSSVKYALSYSACLSKPVGVSCDHIFCLSHARDVIKILSFSLNFNLFHHLR